MTQFRNLKDSEPAIRRFASRVHRRLKAAGAKTIQFEDIEQELRVAWCIACDRFDPSAGATFSTYLHNGMRLHINRWVEQNVDRRHAEVIAFDLNTFPTDSMGGSDASDGASLGEAIPADDPLPDEAVSNTQSADYVKSRLSERAALFVDLLKDPPQELLDEVMKLEEKANYAKTERSITINLNHRLTYVMILDLMGASRGERKQILDEVTEVSDHYCRQVA